MGSVAQKITEAQVRGDEEMILDSAQTEQLKKEITEKNISYGGKIEDGKIHIFGVDIFLNGGQR